MRIFWDLFENGTIAKQYYERRCNERTTCTTYIHTSLCAASAIYLLYVLRICRFYTQSMDSGNIKKQS